MKSDAEIFCENVKELRQRLGLPVEKMAEVLEITPQCLTVMEQGILLPEVDVGILFTIYDQFGIHPSLMFAEHAVTETA